LPAMPLSSKLKQQQISSFTFFWSPGRYFGNYDFFFGKRRTPLSSMRKSLLM
jgi:hypothetical protein